MADYDDGGGVTLTSDFDYAQVDANLNGGKDIDSAADGIFMALECQRKIWAWVYQPPCADLDGFMCRSIIACWIFVPQLRVETMTYVANRFGKEKQSLERWMPSFKQKFPEVVKHIQHLRT